MKNYSSSDPAFSSTIRITESTDPGHADNINAAPQQLLQNTLVLLAMIQQLSGRFVYDEDSKTLTISSAGESSDGGGSISSYTLPVATADTLGGVKIGDGIAVDEEGTISVDLSTLSSDSEAAAAIVDAGTEEMSDEEIAEAFAEIADAGTESE